VLRPFDKGKRTTGIQQLWVGGTRLLALGREPKTYLHMAELWDLGKSRLLIRFDARSRGLLAALSGDGTRIAVEQDQKLLLFETGSMKRLWEIPIQFSRPHWLNGLALSKDGSRVFITGGEPFALRALDGKTGKEKWNVIYRDEPVTTKRVDIELSLDGKLGLLATTVDEQVCTWTTRTGEIRDVFSLHDKRVEATALSGDGKIAATASADGWVKVWESRNGKVLSSWQHEGAVAAVAIAPDGKMACSCGVKDGRVSFRALPSGKEIDSFDVGATKSYASSMVYKPDGKGFFLGLSAGAVFDFEFADAPKEPKEPKEVKEPAAAPKNNKDADSK